MQTNLHRIKCVLPNRKLAFSCHVGLWQQKIPHILLWLVYLMVLECPCTWTSTQSLDKTSYRDSKAYQSSNKRPFGLIVLTLATSITDYVLIDFMQISQQVWAELVERIWPFTSSIFCLARKWSQFILWGGYRIKNACWSSVWMS